MRSLETPRLLLRPWTCADLDAYAEICADPEVMEFMGSGPLDRAAAAERIKRFAAGTALPGVYHWAAEDRETGQLAGQIGLKHQPDWPGPHPVEVAWLLGRRWWGRGLATEGARSSVAYGFEDLGLERVISLTLPENRRSRRVMKRLGMRRRGTEHWRGHDHVWYSLDRDEWAASREGL